MTKSLIIMKIPIRADFQQQKVYTELIQLITASQGMIFKRKKILEDSKQFPKHFSMCTLCATVFPNDLAKS